MSIPTVRNAVSADVPDLLELIKELATYEKEPHAVTTTLDQMIIDGFGENKIFDAFVATMDGKIIGTAITYYRYSTWKGKCLFLEDLIVSEKYRGLGAGKLLFDRCMHFGKENNCTRMNWQVLDWNTPALDFYKTYNAYLDGEWINGSIDL